jgi:hypothetical protein
VDAAAVGAGVYPSSPKPRSPAKSPKRPSPKPCIKPTQNPYVAFEVVVKRKAIKSWGAARDLVARKLHLKLSAFSGPPGQVRKGKLYTSMRITLILPHFNKCPKTAAEHRNNAKIRAAWKRRLAGVKAPGIVGVIVFP